MMRTPLLAVIAAVLVAAAPAAAVLGLSGRPLDGDRYTILVMGSDQGPWRSGTVLGGRADAIHLVSVVPSQNAAAILSFPRDSYVPVPGLGTNRINASLTRGPDTAVETLESLTGIKIDDWIVTGMSAFHSGVSDFGGVEIDVPQRLRIDNNTLDAGLQRLDGPNALLYGRDRKSRSDGDFGRNRAQAELLAAMHSELVARDPSPLELLQAIVTLRQNTVSSMPAGRVPVLAATALSIDPAKVTRRQAPGRNANRGGAAVVVLGGGAETLFADLRDDGLFEQ
jgi:LCP family protein required for cell wall assembly